jgi:hypothetical protein
MSKGNNETYIRSKDSNRGLYKEYVMNKWFTVASYMSHIFHFHRKSAVKCRLTVFVFSRK